MPLKILCLASKTIRLLALLIPGGVALLAANPPVFTENIRPEWQWSAPVASVVSSETQGHPRAFLWIPPACKRLRGVVIGQNNMQEEMIFEHPTFRRALTDLDFAVIWITPAIDLFFRFDQGAGDAFDKMLGVLAAESGYAELALVPIVPLGHSAAASYPWHFGIWSPDRILAAISVSGQWPFYRDKNTPDFGGRNLDGVPGLVTMGEYEGAYDRASVGLKQRAENPRLPLSMLAEPAGEHFAATDLKISFLGLYLRKAAQHRLPADWPVDQRPRLREIDPTKTGWLADRGRPDGKPAAPAAPVASYTGDPRDAFWYFDEELARAVEKFGALHAGKKLQLAAYVQKAGVVAKRKSHVRVGLKTEIENDDLTFRLGATFLDTVDVDWRGLKAGEPAGHSPDLSAFSITRIIGPVERIGQDTFALRFNRGGFDNPKRSGGACFILSHPGDDTYKPAALESEMKIRIVNQEGTPQQITDFNPPASLRTNAKPITLSAKSSAGLPVFFYVREGPAVLEGNTLRLTELPPRTKFPVTITLVAWQWGRPFLPKIQSAAPIERTIILTK